MKDQYNEITDPAMPRKPLTQKVTLRFPTPITRISDWEVEVYVELHDFPIFTEQYREQVMLTMGTYAGEEFLEKTANEMFRKTYIEGIRVKG